MDYQIIPECKDKKIIEKIRKKIQKAAIRTEKRYNKVIKKLKRAGYSDREIGEIVSM